MGTILYLLTASLCLALARRAAPLSLRAAAALLALPLVFTGPALLTGRVYAPIDLAYTSEPMASLAHVSGITNIANPAASDVYTQFVPWNAALRWALAHHEWPLWNPFELGGGILAAAAQSAPYHPLTLLGFLLSQPQALTFAAAMLFFVAALSLFLLARDLELDELASLFGAAAWAFSTHLLSFLHTAHANAIAMMPFVLFAARRVAREPRPRTTALLVIALTLLMLCGHPESMLHVVFLAAAFAAAELFAARRSPLAARAVGFAIAAGLITLLLTAIFVLPLFDAIGQTREYLHRTSVSGGGRHIATWREVLQAIPQQFVPFATHWASAMGGWKGSGYAGALVFAPALYALWRARNRTTWFFASAVVFGWLMGADTPGLTHLFNHLPLFSIAINARMISFAALGLSMLAAIGLDAWRRHGSRDELSYLLGGAAAVTAIAIAAMTPAMIESGLTLDILRVGATRAVLPLLLAFAFCRVLPSSRAVVVALLLLLLVQRGGETASLQPVVDTRAFYPPIAGLDTLPRDETQPYRIVGQGTLFTPDIAAHYELEDVRGYQAMTFARFAATYPLWCQPQPVWSNRVDDLTTPLPSSMLSLMNVRYALATAHAATPAGWLHRGSYPGFELVENPRALPRAFIPLTVHEGVQQQEVVPAMAHARDFGAEAWIENGGAASTHANGRGRIALRRRGSRLRMHIDMDAPGWVVVSEPAWRGWRALDRDRPLALQYADSAFLAFHLDAGSHDVRLFYRPASFVVGSAISGATVLALLVAWGILRRRGSSHELLGSRSPRPAAHALDGHR